MTHPFGEYAQYYDLLYRDKPYQEEARFVGGLLGRFLGKPVAQLGLLDLACGTGRHAEALARMGYRVDGSDIAPEMVDIARERARAAGLSIGFFNESFQDCDRIGRRYDAVIALFASINYLTDYRDLAKALAGIRRLLGPGGVFLFDFWNGNAVVKSYSPVRTRRVEDGERSVERVSRTEIDALAQIAVVRFDFRFMKSGAVLREFSETHRIRYFFPREMADLLLANGFEVAHRCPFMAPDSPPGADEWNLTYVAKPCE
jgi:SAM-dependent methyltransferase